MLDLGQSHRLRGLTAKIERMVKSLIFEESAHDEDNSDVVELVMCSFSTQF